MKLGIDSFKTGFTFGALVLLLTILGCSSGGGDGSASLTGVFLDSPVSGLGYETDTFRGVTGAGGAFSYQNGERIRFFLGDATLCETEAADIITPIDCVAGAMDETDPMVTNLLIFLQSIDFDNDPENGIDITEIMQREARGLQLQLDCDPNEFRQNYDFRNYLQLLNMQNAFQTHEDRIPPYMEQARAHMRETIMENGLDGYGTGMQNRFNNSLRAQEENQ
jgi:hypothetical protein